MKSLYMNHSSSKVGTM